MFFDIRLESAGCDGRGQSAAVGSSWEKTEGAERFEQSKEQ